MNPERDPEDKVMIDVVTFIRLLELAREDIKDDATLHVVAQKVVDLSRGGHVVSMDDYPEIESVMPESGGDDEIEVLKKNAGIPDTMSSDEGDEPELG